MLHGIKEGVVGLDPQHRVTLANDEAMRLLDLPADSVGRTLADLGVDRRLHEVLSGKTQGQDQIVLLGERVLILNRVPVSSRGRAIGSVTTLRDRTELVSLQRELDVTRTTTDTLRAQAHEFSNQLHTISGLIELEEYHEVVRYVSRLTRSRPGSTTRSPPHRGPLGGRAADRQGQPGGRAGRPAADLRRHPAGKGRRAAVGRPDHRRRQPGRQRPGRHRLRPGRLGGGRDRPGERPCG